MNAIQRTLREAPLFREVSTLLDHPVTKVALSILSGLAIAFSIASGKLWIALLPAGYLCYQGYQLFRDNPDVFIRIFGAFVEVAVRSTASRAYAEEPEPTGLRGGSGRGHQTGPRAPVGHWHQNTPAGDDPQLLARTNPPPGHQRGPRAPVEGGNQNTPVGNVRRPDEDDPQLLARTNPPPGHQRGPRAPIGH